MINFSVRLRNPFKSLPFRMIWNWEKKICQHKSAEIQLSYYAFNWLEIDVDLNWRQTDHAGPWVMINLLGLQLDVRMYDHRHWDYEANSWKTYESS